MAVPVLWLPGPQTPLLAHVCRQELPTFVLWLLLRVAHILTLHRQRYVGHASLHHQLQTYNIHLHATRLPCKCPSLLFRQRQQLCQCDHAVLLKSCPLMGP